VVNKKRQIDRWSLSHGTTTES